MSTQPSNDPTPAAKMLALLRQAIDAAGNSEQVTLDQQWLSRARGAAGQYEANKDSQVLVEVKGGVAYAVYGADICQIRDLDSGDEPFREEADRYASLQRELANQDVPGILWP